MGMTDRLEKYWGCQIRISYETTLDPITYELIYFIHLSKYLT